MPKKLPLHFIYSDLHLERSQRSDGNRTAMDISSEINSQLPARGKSVVLLAGDIHYGEYGVEWAKTLNAPVIYVPGNHEFWDRDYSSTIAEMKSRARDSNVHVLINERLELNGVIYIGLVLWTDIGTKLDWPNGDNLATRYCRSIMNDYHTIKHNSWYTPDNTERFRNAYDNWDTEHSISSKQWNFLIQIDLHNEALDYLKSELAQLRGDPRPVVIVAHHPAFYESLFYSRYKPEALHLNRLDEYFFNECIHRRMTRAFDTLEILHYGSDLSYILKDPLYKKPSLWVHGHIHSDVDYVIGSTEIKSNPMQHRRRYEVQVDLNKPVESRLAAKILDNHTLLNGYVNVLEGLNSLISMLETTNQMHSAGRIDNSYYHSVLSLIDHRYNSFCSEIKNIYANIFELYFFSLNPNEKREHYTFDDLIEYVGINRIVSKKKLLTIVDSLFPYEPAFNCSYFINLTILGVNEFSSKPRDEYDIWADTHKEFNFRGDHYDDWLEFLLFFRSCVEKNHQVILMWLTLLKENKLKDSHIYKENNS